MWRRNHHTRQFIDRLRTTSLFCDCSENELRLIASLLTEVWLTAGRVLTRQDTVGSECFIILSGHTVVEHNGALVGHAVAGSVVGELALMGAITRTATVTAATDVQLLVMSPHRVRDAARARDPQRRPAPRSGGGRPPSRTGAGRRVRTAPIRGARLTARCGGAAAAFTRRGGRRFRAGATGLAILRGYAIPSACAAQDTVSGGRARHSREATTPGSRERHTMLRRHQFSRTAIERLRSTSLFRDCSDTGAPPGSSLVTDV